MSSRTGSAGHLLESTTVSHTCLTYVLPSHVVIIFSASKLPLRTAGFNSSDMSQYGSIPGRSR